MFKDSSISQEKYLTDIKNHKVRQNITKLYICAHNLKIETGRHTRPHKTPLENRTCDTCQCKIEDKFHLIIMSKIFFIQRYTVLESLCPGVWLPVYE